MHMLLANFQGNPNIGLFCYANDIFCLVPRGFPSKMKADFERVLKVPVYEVNAAGTSLLGVFFSGNENSLLVPEIMFDSELAALRANNINFHVVKSELTALGNNLLVNSNACIANPDYSDKILEGIGSALRIKIKKGTIAGLNIVGSLAKANARGCLASRDIEGYELKFIRDFLKVRVMQGTLNFGSPFVSSALVSNSNGFIVGDASGGPEVQNADEALGFLMG